MQRIEKCFQRAPAKKLVPFITAGDPSIAITPSLMHALVASGADIIEVGVPFSDPMADGPVIQRASDRALSRGVTLEQILQAVAEFRVQDQETPVVLMGYLNPLEQMGVAAFAAAAAEVGVDGVLIVDLPLEEASHLTQVFKSSGLAMIFLVSPTTSQTRMRQISELASGYLYYVSLRGVTGAARTIDLNELQLQLQQLTACTDLPVMVGFGIKDAATAQSVAGLAQGVVVGSAIVELLENLHQQQSMVEQSMAGQTVLGQSKQDSHVTDVDLEPLKALVKSLRAVV